MSVVTEGTRLITSIVLSDDIEGLNTFNRELLVGESEIGTFKFVTDHYNQYGNMPQIETILRNGHTVVRDGECSESISYYRNALINRHVINSTNDIIGDLSRAMMVANTTEIKRILEASLALVSQYDDTTNDTPSILQVGQDLLETLRENQSAVDNGVMTGYAPIDNDLMGLKAGEMMILAGRPKRGKTYILLTAIINAWLGGNNVMFVSMEMSPEGIVGRILAMIAQMNPRTMRGRMSSRAYTRVSDTLRGFDDMPDFHFVAGNFRKTSSDITRYAKSLKPQLIGVDGAYLLSPNDRTKFSAKHELLGDVINDRKASNEDLGIPSIDTVQFNRNAAGAKGKNGVTNSDELGSEFLSGSDAYLQNATAVVGVGKIAGRENVRRLKMMDSRDGESSADFVANFNFSPPNFSYISDYVEGDENDDDVQISNDTLNMII